MRDYIQKAIRTESLDLFDPNKHPRLIHVAMGVTTEAVELLTATDSVNAAEEIGDILWYLAVGCDALDCTFEDLRKLSPELDESNNPFHQLVVGMGDMTDVMKRATYYGPSVAVDELRFGIAMGQVLRAIDLFLKYRSIPIEECMRKNIAKLAKRYPDKFTTEKAVDRDLDAERAVLEKG